MLLDETAWLAGKTVKVLNTILLSAGNFSYRLCISEGR